jgi:hypothetical protein
MSAQFMAQLQNRGGSMRWILVVLAYVLLPAQARASDLKIEDLYGLSIKATAVHHGTFRLEEKQGPGEITISWNVHIDGQGVAETSMRRQVKTPRRTGQLNRTFKGAIGQPGKVGDGHFVWVLKGDSLTLLRVLEVGGHTITFKLSKNGNGWICGLESSMAREIGAGNSRTQSALERKVTIIRMKQVSSSCQASKKG